MKHYILFSVVIGLLVATGFSSCSMELGPYGETVYTPVEGTLYIDLPDTIPYDYQESGLSGTFLVVIGKHEHTIYPSVITYDYILHRLKIPVSATVNFEGVAVITGVSRLSYTEPDPEEEDPEAESGEETGGETPETGPEDPYASDPEGQSAPEDDAEAIQIPYTGYLITSLSKDRTNWINDTDHDGFNSTIEQETMPLKPATRFYTDALETEPVQAESTPQIEFFTSYPQYTTPDLSVAVSGTVSSLEWALVYVRINKQYHWIETVRDPYLPDTASIPEAPYDPVLLSLKPGMNEIQLIAVNSNGMSCSDTISVDCTALLDEDRENILITLTWDTLADLDLHTWYYPPGSTDAAWHNSYADKEAPDTDELVNLDADNHTGFGPEHFTLFGAPDGYYIIAVNAYSLSGLPAVNAFVSIETNERLNSLGPFRITEESEDTYPINDNLSWRRIADILITDGVAEIHAPDLNIEPPELYDPLAPSMLPLNMMKSVLKFR